MPKLFFIPFIPIVGLFLVIASYSTNVDGDEELGLDSKKHPFIFFGSMIVQVISASILIK